MQQAKKLILVPVDFSNVSIEALELAGKIAHKVNGEILLLHVVETYDENVGLDEKLANVNETTVKAKLEEIRAEKQSLWGVNTMVIERQGKIHKVIREVANEKNAWMIIMGTTGASGLSDISRFLLGSNALRTVQLSEAPVLTIREGNYNGDFKNILLPLQAGKPTLEKVDYAMRFALAFNSTVHILAVTSEFEYAGGKDKDVEEMMKMVADKLVDQGLKVTVNSVHEKKNVGEEINDYSEKMNSDLTIIMTRQESAITDLIMGSRARTIITKSTRPVLSLRPEQAVDFN